MTDYQGSHPASVPVSGPTHSSTWHAFSTWKPSRPALLRLGLPCNLLPLFLTLLLQLSGCSTTDSGSLRQPAIVAVVGIDGGDWDVLNPLIQAGKLPALAWMKEHGATARLQIESARSPESWTSIATGQPPAVHGIVQDHLNPLGSFSARPDQIEVKRIWDIAGERGKRSLVVDYWITYPAYPMNGVLVSRESRGAWPSGAEDYAVEPIMPQSHSQDLERLGLLSRRTGIMKAYMGKGGFDLMLLPFYSLDHALHQLWSEFQVGLQPELLSSLDGQTADRVRAGYDIVVQTAMLADTLLGHAYHSVGDDGYVLVVSDHGFNRARPPMRRLAISRKLLDGAMGTAEHGIIQVPNARITLTAHEEQHRGQVEELDFVLSYPEIQVEGSGAAAVTDRLRQATMSDGTPVFVPSGTGTLLPSPTVLEQVATSLGGNEYEQYSIFVNTGAHATEDLGIFGIYGPGVQAGELEEPARSVDITPTCLWLMGLPAAEDMAGRPVTRAFTPRALKENPVKYLPTYEDGTRPWAVPSRYTLSDSEKERLKALGYVK